MRPAPAQERVAWLATADEKLLLRRYAAAPSASLEAAIVQRFMPLAKSLARRYRGPRESDEDLLQVASMALVKSLRRFDPDRGRPFAAFAVPTIIGELRRHFRDHSWSVRVPRGLQESALAVEAVAGELAEERGRTPTVAQIAKRAGIEEEAVLEALTAHESRRAISLERPVSTEDASATLMDRVVSHEPGFDQVEAQLAAGACAGLDEREMKALQLRFFDDMTQLEIAKRLEISQMQVSRILRRGLAKMLEAVQGEERPDGRRIFEENRSDPRFPRGRVRRVRTAQPANEQAA